MNLVLCGSIAFIDEMVATKEVLEGIGHTVQMPPLEIPDEKGRMIPVKEYYAIRKSAMSDDAWVWERKAKAIKTHFDKVVWSEAILVLNYTKNNIDHYIGPNTLLEMGIAFHYQKVIYLLNPIPSLSYTEEILGMRPTILEGDLALIKNPLY